jgi:hypothetical protein
VTSHPAATTAPETTRRTTATAASTHATKAGPVGRGAPFGPGQLG